MKLSVRTRKRLIVASLFVGVALFAGGYTLVESSPPQVKYYNLAMAEYKEAFNQTSPKAAVDKLNAAIADFDRSYAAYQSDTTETGAHRAIYGSASAEYAALAQFHKGVALTVEAQITHKNDLVNQAAQAFVESLRINPGGPYMGVSQETADRLNEEALVTKYDLELLLKKHPEAQTKKPANGKGKPNPQQAPNANPGNMPGHGDPNSL